MKIINIDLNDDTLLFKVYKGIVTEREGDEIEVVLQDDENEISTIFDVREFYNIPDVGSDVELFILLRRNTNEQSLNSRSSNNSEFSAFKEKGVSGQIEI